MSFRSLGLRSQLPGSHPCAPDSIYRKTIASVYSYRHTKHMLWRSDAMLYCNIHSNHVIITSKIHSNHVKITSKIHSNRMIITSKIHSNHVIITSKIHSNNVIIHLSQSLPLSGAQHIHGPDPPAAPHRCRNQAAVLSSYAARASC